MRKSLLYFFMATIAMACFQLVAVSCGEKTSKIVEGAKVVACGSAAMSEARSVQGVPFPTGNVPLGAVAIYDIGGGCVLFQMMSGAYCFSWMDMATGETQGVILRGRGPDEMVEAGFSGYRINEKGEAEIAVYSLSMEEIMYINLTQSLAADKTVVISRNKLPKGTMYALAGNTSLYCYTFGDDQTVSWKCAGADGAETVIQPFGRNGRVSDSSKYFAATTLSRDGDFLVMGMASFPRLFLFGADGERVAISLSEESDDQILAMLNGNNPDSSDYCVWTQVKDGLVYYLMIDHAAMASGDFKENLLVFDLKGKLKSAYGISTPLTSFIVQDAGGSIVGITMDGELYKYVI